MKINVTNNSEILFLYDAAMTNPNGDLDDENRPRMDKLTKTNLVSDVRLKRYIRDYLFDFKGEDIWLRQSENAKDAKQRFKEIKSVENAKKLIDIRLFGAVFTDTNAETLTGPVQFTWGKSLNEVELLKTDSITSHFKTSGSKDSEGGGGIGRDYRVKYSFLAFSGSINLANAKKTGLTDEDVDALDESMVKAIPLSRTRSKIGQSPRLYLRVEMDKDGFLNDLRDYIRLAEDERVDTLRDVTLDVTDLVAYLTAAKNIRSIVLWQDPQLKVKCKGTKCDLKSELETVAKVTTLSVI